MKKKIFVFLFDGFSDWEISYVTPEINKSDRFELVSFSETGYPLTSMGGLQIKPTMSLHEVNDKEIQMLILPGGAAWERGELVAITDLLKKVVDKGTPVAAICGATVFLGQSGLLTGVNHTSNALYYLRQLAPGYHGDEMYRDALAVTDHNIITANGIAPIEFAREIFKTIELYDDDKIERWFQLFKNGIWSE